MSAARQRATVAILGGVKRSDEGARGYAERKRGPNRAGGGNVRQGALSTWRPLGVSRSSAAGNRREEYVVPDRVGLCLFRQRAREPLLSLVSARGFKGM